MAKLDARMGLVWGRILFGGFLLVGCHKDFTAINTFQSAGPERKAVWDAAVSAMNSNDYLGAITNLDSLLALTDLSAEQHKAVKEAEDNIRGRLFTAAEKGDANAQKAVEELRQARMR